MSRLVTAVSARRRVCAIGIMGMLALAERVNGILKDEFHLDAFLTSFTDAHAAVAQAVHTYNTRRLHGSLQRQTPAQVFHQAA